MPLCDHYYRARPMKVCVATTGEIVFPECGWTMFFPLKGIRSNFFKVFRSFGLTVRVRRISPGSRKFRIEQWSEHTAARKPCRLFPIEEYDENLR